MHAGFIPVDDIDQAVVYLRYHLPNIDGPWRRPVVLVAGDGEERTWSYRPLLNLARALATRGHPVARFDFRGQGESDGRFEDTSIDTRLADIDAVVAHVRDMFALTPHLVSLRLGATLAAHWIAQQAQYDGVIVAIEPVTSPPAYLHEQLCKHTANQYSVHGRVLITEEQLRARMRAGEPANCNGYLLTERFATSLNTLTWESDRNRCPRVCLLRLVGTRTRLGDLVPEVRSLWKEPPDVRYLPTSLFELVGRAVDDDARCASRSSLEGLSDASRNRHILCLTSEKGAFSATFHEAQSPRSTYLFVSPGPNDRAGPHGSYCRLAETLCAAGHSVLRIDAHGAGESDGADSQWHGQPMAALFRAILDGAHVSAVLRAVRWVQEHRAQGPIVLTGLCGGAMSSALAASQCPGVDVRLVLQGLPVLYPGSATRPVLATETMQSEFRASLAKLSNRQALRRLLTGKSDIRALERIVAWRVGVSVRRKLRRREVVAPQLHADTNYHFLEAWHRLLVQRTPVTFVFAEHDPLYPVFREHFAPFVRKQPLPPFARVQVIAGVNHTVTERSGEAVLASILTQAAR